MPAASPEAEDVLSAQDSPNSSPDTGLTVGIAIATVFLVGGLVVLGVLVRMKKKKQAKLGLQRGDMPVIVEDIPANLIGRDVGIAIEQELGPTTPTASGDKPLGRSASGDKPAVKTLMVNQV